MNSLTTLLGSGLRSVRTLGLATAVAGVAVVGLTSGAPALAAPSATGPAAAAPATAGPGAFVQIDHGVVPIFFCEPAKPHKHHNTAKHPFKCTNLTGPRF